MPRIAGSYPGYVFTGEPLRLAAGHFGLGHGSGAHAPDEYFVIEPSNPNVSDWDGAVASHAAISSPSRTGARRIAYSSSRAAASPLPRLERLEPQPRRVASRARAPLRGAGARSPGLRRRPRRSRRDTRPAHTRRGRWICSRRAASSAWRSVACARERRSRSLSRSSLRSASRRCCCTRPFFVPR